MVKQTRKHYVFDGTTNLMREANKKRDCKDPTYRRVDKG